MASDYSFGIFSRKKNVSIKSINNCRSYTTFVSSIVNDFAVVGSAIDFQHPRECYCLKSGLTRVSESPYHIKSLNIKRPRNPGRS